jgi:hypothetical protein|tara:strand:- start:1084 stop:2325 length:1242 start_codon:yes stop_codon:yes gene_type:complete
MASKKVAVYHQSPLAVRLYNHILIFLQKIRFLSRILDVNSLIAESEKHYEHGHLSNGIYKQGLQRLVNNINSNNLNSATRIFLKGEIHRSLTNRLRIAEFVNKNPDVNNTDLNDPIFILGLPRSGTTALQAMFACIDVCRVLKLWELHYPTAFGEGEQAIKRAKNKSRHYAFLQNFSKPEQKYIHPVDAELPDECFRLLFNSFTSLAMSSAVGLDSYEDWVLQCDMIPSYNEYKQQLQILYLSLPDKQLVLKAPEHLWHLDTLFETFPTARVIWTHRDPFKAIVSYASMISMFRRTAYANCDFKKIGPYLIEIFEKGLKKAVLFRKKINREEQFIDVHCNEINRMPTPTMEKICNHFSIEVNKQDKVALQGWFEAKRDDLPGVHIYDSDRYGISANQVKDTFQFYNDELYITS